MSINTLLQKENFGFRTESVGLGLTSDEVKYSREKHGENKLCRLKSDSFIKSLG